MKRYDTDDITKALFFAARGGYLGIVEFIFEKSVSQSRLEWDKIFLEAIDEGLPNIFEVINPQNACTRRFIVIVYLCVCVCLLS
jgi:hypothetical protein